MNNYSFKVVIFFNELFKVKKSNNPTAREKFRSETVRTETEVEDMLEP